MAAAPQNSPIVHLNKVRAACKEGKVQAGCFLAEIRQPSVAQLLAAGGLDFFMVDNEHGQFSIDKIAEICTVARYAGITPFVRVPDYSYSHIAQSLDAGAQGLIFPRITSPEQVHAIIDTARYPPEGNRGNATNRNYCDFRVGDVTQVMATHNRETMLIFQVETKECLERLDEILSIKGVDGVLIGPNDLSISLGVPGQINHPMMLDAFNKVLDTCRKHNVVPGCHINDPTLASQWAAKGFRFVSSSSDTFFVQNGAANVNTLIKNACK